MSMKMILIVADAARLDPIRRDLAALDAPGYTAWAVSEGAGRTGLHTGDRVHPGALATLFVVEAEPQATALFEELVRRRDAAGDRITRLFLAPVERQA
jgi:hypothetical protein